MERNFWYIEQHSMRLVMMVAHIVFHYFRLFFFIIRCTHNYFYDLIHPNFLQFLRYLSVNKIHPIFLCCYNIWYAHFSDVLLSEDKSQ